MTVVEQVSEQCCQLVKTVFGQGVPDHELRTTQEKSYNNITL